eukprot:scaffold7.g3657.t1
MAAAQPSALELLAARRDAIANDLAKLEKQASGQLGFEGFLTSKSAQAKNKNRVFKLDDRAFSLSSVTSPASQELVNEREQAAQEALYNRATPGGGGGGKGAFNPRTVMAMPPPKPSRRL